MKELVSAILIGAMVFSVCSCKDESVTKVRNGSGSSSGSKEGITMQVHVNYGGCGVAGQDLGSGEFDYEVEDIKEGDIFFEDLKGNLSTTCRGSEPDKYWYIKIKSIDEDGVIVESHEGDYDMKFGEEDHFNTVFWVCDGTNYDYDITFVNN